MIPEDHESEFKEELFHSSYVMIQTDDTRMKEKNGFRLTSSVERIPVQAWRGTAVCVDHGGKMFTKRKSFGFTSTET